MAGSPTIGYVTIELDVGQTGSSFGQLKTIVEDAAKNVSGIIVRLDKQGTENELKKLKTIVDTEVNKIKSSINPLGNITINGLDINNSLRTISANINQIRTLFDQLTNTMNNTGKSGAQAFSNLIAGEKEYEARLTKLTSLEIRAQNEISKYSATGGDAGRAGLLNNLEAALARIQQLKSDMQSSTMTARAWDTEYTQAFRDFAVASAEAARAGELLTSSSSGYDSKLTSITKKQEEVNRLLREYSSAARSSKTGGAYDDLIHVSEGFQKLRTDLEGGKLTVQQYNERYNQLVQTMTQSSGVITQNGRAHKSLLDIIKGVPAAFGAYLTSARLVSEIIKLFKQASKAAIELQDALVDLQIVTGSSNDELREYTGSVTKTAQSLGVATKDIMTATTTYARLGYSLADSDTLAKYTTMLEKVGNIDPSAAQDAVTAMLAAFPEDVNIDNVERTMDKLVTVGKLIAQQHSNVLKEIGYIG